MTTNHPAHGAASLDRLHQISEILSKAAAQSDGGNLGYAMADAVKVINGTIAAFDAKPVAVNDDMAYTFHHALSDSSLGADEVEEIKIGLRAAFANIAAPQPALVVPDELLSAMEEVLRISDRDHEAWHKARNGIAHFRAAMIQAGNSPVTPGGWIPVSERMPERDVDVQVYCADKKEQMVGYMERNETEGWFRFASLPNGGGVYCKPTHWMPLPAAPQQEVK
ncbi:DUF551 domain-containing protein [Salmonella enterica]|nr:DUF551 domain-containing protein [Salmonella enterica]EDR1020668.1 DUF551 domain-containing protein [Salmonella enterica subsp. enterica serovar Uganda]EGN0030417.1 DUF551 domain-containing protein [Salmonella enterica subsp. enterica serovar Orion]EAN3769479.1 DUF551 domain-containing protein [Salmonella enterica]EAP4575390.1 DUF551 domain-containing protein [Salmonella enterica]